MSFIWIIIDKIDDFINRIPLELAGQLKKLFSFILFVLVILAIFIGYRLGREASIIPGDPLINYTNEIFRQLKSKKAAGASLRLAEEDSLLINFSKDEFTEKSQVPPRYGKSFKLNPKTEDRYINMDGNPGLDFEKKLQNDRIKELGRIDMEPIGIDFLGKERAKISINNTGDGSAGPFPFRKDKKLRASPLKLPVKAPIELLNKKEKDRSIIKTKNIKNRQIKKKIIRNGLKSEKPLYNY